jgi:membrane carboxypeptidase/penicillin-binding protein
MARKPKRIHRSRRVLGIVPLKLVVIGFAICLVLAIAGGITFYFMLKPHVKIAATYDLERINDLMVPSIIYDRNGKEFQQIDIQNRRPASIDAIPLHFIQALTAAEDSRFFEHEGVDYTGIARAILLNLKAGGVTQGASTITQQLARNSFKLQERSIQRKLTEACLARRIEKRFSKAQILEFYLNRIYFGSGFYGANAAALGYFGKSIDQLDIPESATICGLIKSPNRLSPLNDPAEAKKSRDNVLRRMLAEKSLSEADCEKYQKMPLEVKRSRKGLDYVNQYIAQKVIDELGFENAASGGFKVYTTIDVEIQDTAREALLRQLKLTEDNKLFVKAGHETYAHFKETHRDTVDDPVADPLSAKEKTETAVVAAPNYLQGALLMIDNHTGAIIAMVGGRDYVDTEFNRATQAYRPAGTAFTPFVFAAAFEKGYFPGSTVEDDYIDNTRVGIGGATGVLGEWGVESDKPEYEGTIPAREALVMSKNSATVRMGMQAGLDETIKIATEAGMGERQMEELNSTFLGNNVVSLAALVKAYTIFPNGGERPEGLHIITAIRDNDGKLVYSPPDPTKNPVRVIDEISSYQVHSCLTEVLSRGTGKDAFGQFGLRDKYAAGKTGTAYNFTDLWFVGYNNRITCGVWAGFDKPRVPVYFGAFSREHVLPVWVDTMNAAQKSFPSEEIQPPQKVATIEICRKSGLRATDKCYEQQDGNPPRYVRSTYREIIRKGTVFDKYCTYHSEAIDRSADDPFANTGRRESDPTGTGREPLAPILATSEAQPVELLGPTLVGDVDPYHSVQPVFRNAPVEGEGNEEIRRATPVNPVAIGESKAVISLRRPPPIAVPSPD